MLANHTNDTVENDDSVDDLEGVAPPIRRDSDVGEPGFRDLGLHDSVQRQLTELGYEEPTPIQAQAIPVL
ncbi:MAG: DEAD/DEAH box helicase, partial [Acidimicrobiia bacterium]|nr:DEAD/DEAH box helicase [Acidimicrobiia bacterium]